MIRTANMAKMILKIFLKFFQTLILESSALIKYKSYPQLNIQLTKANLSSVFE
jgi:hypothetical protein